MSKNNILRLIAFIIALIILGVSIYVSVHQRSNNSSMQREGQNGVPILTGTVEAKGKDKTSETKTSLSTVQVSFYDRTVCTGRIYGQDCLTASGEIFDDQGLTFASRNLRFGTNVRFHYGDTFVVCRANDRGPFVDGRSFDLSRGCAERLGIISRGVATIRWEIAE